MILRLLNVQGIAGVAVASALGILLIGAKIDARHWHKQSAQFERLYRAEVASHARTVAAYRAAAAAARSADRLNAERVRAARQTISERIADDFEARLAAARAHARRLRASPAAAAYGAARTALLPAPSASAPSVAQAAGEDGFSGSDRLIATEQAIQLDELIRWVRAQAAVPPDQSASAPERR